VLLGASAGHKFNVRTRNIKQSAPKMSRDGLRIVNIKTTAKPCFALGAIDGPFFFLNGEMS
jgi:hypothetical protein